MPIPQIVVRWVNHGKYTSRSIRVVNGEGTGGMLLHDVDNFGAIDADADDLLDDCFQDHPAYVAAREMQRFLVLGRKGAGKTAIYKRLTRPMPNSISLGHVFDDYPWHHHDLQAQVGVPEERRFTHSWKYLILLSLAKLLLNDDDQPWGDGDEADAIERIENFVVDSYGSPNPDLSQLFSPTKELRFRAKGTIPFLEIIGERVRVRDLPVHIQAVNRAITENVMCALNPHKRYYVCFDGLDLGQTEKYYPERLIGLILAAKDLFITARSAGRYLNVVVFLRDDIYERLHFEDKNKVTENFSVSVRWNEHPDEPTLKDLMQSRFTAALSAPHTWEKIFDESKQMPGRQTKYKHICDRTYLRPRDMIKFCNEILDDYKRSPNGTGKFENSSVHNARPKYSYYLLRELDDEIAKHVPSYKDYIEVLKSIGSEIFQREDFASRLAARGVAAGPFRALEGLFEFSVIGYLQPGGRTGGSEYVWRYRDPRARFDSSARTYRVHPGYKEALNLVRSSG